MSKDLLLEIGVEEMPARYIETALVQMEEGLKRLLTENRIAHGQVATYSTPRRLTVVAMGVAESGEDVTSEVTGPPAKVAFDAEGKPTRAALGFAKVQGVDVKELAVKNTPKGDYLVANKREKGKPTAEVLPGILADLINSLSFPRSMRWGSVKMRFARPIRWLLVLFGDSVVQLEIAGVRSGDFTYGHRFLHPAKITINRPSEYLQALERAFVIADHRRRKEMIKNQVTKKAQEGGCVAMIEEDLLDEVTNLVEYPTPISGRFDESFLEVPSEVIITSMSKNQRYFPVLGRDGALRPLFIAISNMKDNLDEITKGNENVIRARLSDARFFFSEDKKTSLADLVLKLKGILFQEDLGTVYDKAQRLVKLSQFIAERTYPGVVDKAKRASLLCKADLASQMVFEFPELQGVMGREYAVSSGEDEEVAIGIYEHYLPKSADSELPRTRVGIIVSLADKLDTVVGCLGVGLIPTGSADPYALRRQASGIVRMVVSSGLRLSLSDMMDGALGLLGDKLKRPPDDVKKDVLEFTRDRIEPILRGEGFRYDEVDSVLSAGYDDLSDLWKRARAVSALRKSEGDFDHIITAFKRVFNILKGIEVQPLVDERVLVEREEKELYARFVQVREKAEPLIRSQKYEEALTVMTELRKPVDDIFDEVMIMDKDERLRKNRLGLMRSVADLFLKVVDFSKIVADQK
jgi:glycyl-tRNA synthetase beta chain